jgi:GR25 family glycosyltransferase involved in LPS biosynthesis
MKKALKENYENILILEDDTLFISNNITINEILDKYSNFLDINNYGIFYLAGNTRADYIKNIINDIYLTKSTLTTGSYIINKKVMQYIVDNIKGYPREIDVFYANVIQQKFPCFICIPNITSQRPSYSDIVGINTNYNLNILK